MKRATLYIENVTSGSKIVKSFNFGTMRTMTNPDITKGRYTPTKWYDVSMDFYNWLCQIYDANNTIDLIIRFTENSNVGYKIHLVPYSLNGRVLAYNTIYWCTRLNTLSYEFTLHFLLKPQLEILANSDAQTMPYNCHLITYESYPYTGGSVNGLNFYYDYRVGNFFPCCFATPLMSFYPDPWCNVINASKQDIYLKKAIKSIKFTDKIRESVVNTLDLSYYDETNNLVRSVTYAVYNGTTVNSTDRASKLYDNSTWKNMLKGVEVEDIPTPNSPSVPSGGEPSYDDTTEEIKPVTPVVSPAYNFGYLWRVPNAQKMREIKSWLLSPNFLDSVSRLFSNPIDYITGALSLPIIASGIENNLIVGGVDSGIKIIQILEDTVWKSDVSSITLNHFFDNFLDYSPYTKLKLFLPYIGIVELNPDFFIDNEINIKYNVDILTGACVAFVSNSTNIIGMYNGNCGTQIPIKSIDYNNAITNTLSNTAMLAVNASTGNVAGAVANTASIVANLKPNIQHSGALSSCHGKIANRRPFLLVSRPQISIPYTFSHDVGFKSNVSKKLSELSGFTVVESIDLSNVSCTEKEKDMLNDLLTTGVFV